VKATNPWVRIFINDIHADPNLAMLGRAARWSFFELYLFSRTRPEPGIIPAIERKLAVKWLGFDRESAFISLVKKCKNAGLLEVGPDDEIRITWNLRAAEISEIRAKSGGQGGRATQAKIRENKSSFAQANRGNGPGNGKAMASESLHGPSSSLSASCQAGVPPASLADEELPF